MSKPSLKLLQKNGVITDVSAKWYQLGIVLLEDERVNQLANIKANNHNVTDCCYAMFSYWIQTQPNASWHQLVKALKERGVEMNDVAKTVKEIFIGLCTFIHYCIHHCIHHCIHDVFHYSTCGVCIYVCTVEPQLSETTCSSGTLIAHHFKVLYIYQDTR